MKGLAFVNSALRRQATTLTASTNQPKEARSSGPWSGRVGVLARLQALLTDLSVYSRRGYSGEEPPSMWWCNDVFHMDEGMVSMCLHELTPIPPKRVLRFILWHCSWGGVQRNGTWVIRLPPTEDTLTQTAQWHQANPQAAKNSFTHLNTHQALLRLHPSYFHNCWRHLKSKPSQHHLPGSIWTGLFMWNVFHKQLICVCFRKC